MQPQDPDQDPRPDPSGAAPEGGASDRGVPSDGDRAPSAPEDLSAEEDRLRLLLGEDAAPRPREAFRAELRAQFTSGGVAQVTSGGVAQVTSGGIAQVSAGGIAPAADEREALGGAVDDALQGWNPAPSPAARDRARAAFVVAGAASTPEPAPRAVRRSRRSAHAPAPATHQRMRLLVGGAAALVAAAALLLVARPAWLGLSGPTGGDVPVVPGRGDAPVVADARWSLDLQGRDADEVLALLRVDGAAAADVEDLAARLDTAVGVTTLDGTVRLRRGEEFVMELGPGTDVVLPAADESVYRVGRGALRIATGPALVGGTLVVETPHVRTQVLGTIFGIDVGDDYSCVCCLEGEVWTEPLIDGCEDCGIGPVSTRVVTVDGSPYRGPLVDAHAAPLRELVGYWS